MISQADRETVKARAKGMCELCGLPCHSPHLHHRQARGMGGGGDNSVSNVMALHPSCHLKHIEAQRTRAYENGWLVHKGTDPATVPLRYMLNRIVMFDNSGNVLGLTMSDR